MASRIHEAIQAFLSAPAYHRCLLLVHREIRTLEETASQLASEYGWQRLPIGRELSAVLMAEAHRAHAASQWLSMHLVQMAPGPVLCTEIDLLFEPTLSLDPLKLFEQISRQTRLVVTWPGTYMGDTLAYALPEHRHYRTWQRPGVLIQALT